MALSRIEKILEDTIAGVQTTAVPLSRNEALLLELQKQGGGSGGGVIPVDVDVLPDEGVVGVIYSVPSEDGEEGNMCDEYIWNGTAYELIGQASSEIPEANVADIWNSYFNNKQ